MNKSINFVAPINTLGYGVAASNIVKAAHETSHPIALLPIGNVDAPSGIKIAVDEAIERGHNFKGNAPSVRMYHQFDLALHCGSPRYGFPFFELDTFTDRERHHLNNQDAILVSSQWAVDVIRDNHITVPTYVVPLGVDRSIFYEGSRSHQPDEATVFFNVGKWEIRKGHDILIEAFEKAFSKEDNVRLVMACYNPFYSPQENMEWSLRYRSGKLGDKVHTYNYRLGSQQEIADIMRSADVGVFPARGEGWNLDMLEAMSCGKHIITTNNTAHTEFCTKENSCLIDVPEKEKAYDGKWFFGQGNWGKLETKQIDELAGYMVELHKQKQLGNLKPNQAGIDIANKFSWSNTVETMWRHVHG